MATSKAGVNSQSGNRLDDLEVVISTLATKRITTRQLTAASETLLTSDLNNETVSNSAVSQTVDISDALNSGSVVGDKISLLQFGVGVPSITVSGAQTVNGGTVALPLSAQYQGVVITKIADNVWCVSGAV